MKKHTEEETARTVEAVLAATSDDARRAAIAAYLDSVEQIVRSAALRICRGGRHCSDLIQDGMVVALESVSRLRDAGICRPVLAKILHRHLRDSYTRMMHVASLTEYDVYNFQKCYKASLNAARSNNDNVTQDDVAANWPGKKPLSRDKKKAVQWFVDNWSITNGDYVQCDDDGFAQVERSIDSAAVVKAINSLGEIDAKIIKMRYLDGEEHGTIGAAFGMTKQGSSWRCQSAVKKLREAMNEC